MRTSRRKIRGVNEADKPPEMQRRGATPVKSEDSKEKTLKGLSGRGKTKREYDVPYGST